MPATGHAAPVALPFQLELPPAAPLEERLDRAVRRVVDEHGSRLGRRLEPRRDVDRVAERGVLDPRPAPTSPDHDRSRRGADPDAEALGAPAAPHLARVLLHLADDAERAANGPLGVVLAVVGAPKNASTPSPARSLTWPPSDSTSPTIRATASPTTSFTSSGSSRSPSAVEPTTSAKTAVRTFRSSRTLASGLGLVLLRHATF